MRVHVTFVFDEPLDVVVRDTEWELLHNMEAYGELLGLRHISLSSMEENPDGTWRVEHHFRAFDEVPSFARAFIQPHMLEWKQISHWDPDNCINSFTIEPGYLKDYFSYEGSWAYRSLPGGRTERILDGEMHLNLPLIGPLAEQFLRQRVLVAQHRLNDYLEKRIKFLERKGITRQGKPGNG